ncbi:RNA polymerase sigma factor (sigma-70 family) [Arthrobacter stackebrandtii]|uniref:RNA polymerase sigma factor (Sigma-70 family) n=1 Tax=Arthrobacter stackebrandtii TaxID=272161 RepID=A0ABS4YUD9_9MICC|nr:RNA polymerase sigma factor (sigma-70 family) [Arthrobacter stackebrandtii]
MAGGSVPAVLPPFEAVVSAHGAMVLRVCRALVGPSDADDVWQETFLAALRAYPASSGVRNREAWLVTIARNKAVDHHRRAARIPVPDGAPGLGGEGADARGRGGRLPGGDGAGGGAPGGGDAVVRAVEAGETAAGVWAALARLPRMQREAVVYHHLAGLRHAEVAELLGNSEAAARRASADGMKSLRALLLPGGRVVRSGRDD